MVVEPYDDMMSTVDAFPFFNELDLLELRLETLDPYVDFFVISEATTTFSGNPKPLYLSENLSRFSRYRDKMIVNIVDMVPDPNPHVNDPTQKNMVRSALESLCEDDDVVLWGDADEFPNPHSISLARDWLRTTTLVHFAQHLHYYYLDLRETSGNLLSSSGDFPEISHPKWLGTRAMKWAALKNRELNSLREPSSLGEGRRLEDGGWHFSFVGSPGLALEERVDVKISAYAHQELNRFRFRLGRNRRLRRGKDVFGRRSKLRICPQSELPWPVAHEPAKYSTLLCPSQLARRVKPLKTQG